VCLYTSDVCEVGACATLVSSWGGIFGGWGELFGKEFGYGCDLDGSIKLLTKNWLNDSNRIDALIAYSI
jgi:hypothetical protein